MGVFARWVVGFGVFAVVFAFLGFGASVGWWGALCLTAPSWCSLGVHAPRVGVLAWAVVLRAGLVGKVGRGMIVSPLRCGCAPDACAWKRGGCSRSGGRPFSLVIACMEAGSRPVGAEQGGGSGRAICWPGWGRRVVVVACSPCLVRAISSPGSNGACLGCVGLGVGRWLPGSGCGWVVVVRGSKIGAVGWGAIVCSWP